MPWRETDRVFERVRFIDDYLTGSYTITESRDDVQREPKTLYKNPRRLLLDQLDRLQPHAPLPIVTVPYTYEPVA
jgi:hypothetical protein